MKIRIGNDIRVKISIFDNSENQLTKDGI
jgi:uncharacterized protein YjdB